MTLGELLGALRRRLRLAWTVDTVQQLAPAVLGVAIAVVSIGWLRPWAWPEPVAVGLLAAGAVTLVVAAAMRSIPDSVVARAADRGLHTGDAIATRLEIDEADPVFGARIVRRADAIAATARPREVVPVPTRRAPLLAVGILAATLVLLVVAPSGQDDVRDRLARERQAITDTADDLRRAARELRKPAATAAERATARELDRAAQRLERSGDLRSAQRALDQQRQQLATDAPPAAQRAATKGLEQGLGTNPLAGTTGSASQQLRQLGDQAATMTPAEREAAAQRLSELAETQRQGNPEAAAAMDEAARALRDGDAAGAAAALGGAASSHDASQTDLDRGDGKAAASEGLAGAGRSMSERAAGRSTRGSGSGRGQRGSGSGQGSGSGKGSGAGNGAGSGSGSGNGGAGNVNGQVTGGGGATGGTGSGRGAGQAGSGQGVDGPKSEESGAPKVYAPPPGSAGDQLQAEANRQGGDGRTTGKSNGPTQAGQSQVPLADAIAAYQAQATEALGRADLPASVRAQVRTYFDQLAAQGDEPSS